MATNEKLNLTMLCDFYELTMANGYFHSPMKDKITYFDMFFRRVPDGGGFAIAAGLEQIVQYIQDLHFDPEDIEYLRNRNLFDEDFLQYLADFRFTGDIRDKYVAPPYTTDFGIMFLPIEGLYAEVVRRGLIETLQNEYHINIAGPTTMAALLNSLQMGFRTLAIEKRSSEVWTVLAAVKTEFSKFGGMLKKVQQNLETAGSQLDEVMGRRTRVIERKLRSIQELPADQSAKILAIESTLTDEEE